MIQIFRDYHEGWNRFLNGSLTLLLRTKKWVKPTEHFSNPSALGAQPFRQVLPLLLQGLKRNQFLFFAKYQLRSEVKTLSLPPSHSSWPPKLPMTESSLGWRRFKPIWKLGNQLPRLKKNFASACGFTIFFDCIGLSLWMSQDAEKSKDWFYLQYGKKKWHLGRARLSTSCAPAPGLKHHLTCSGSAKVNNAACLGRKLE